MSRETRKYAILIGINNYHESLGKLTYAVNDAKELANVLGKGSDAIPEKCIFLLTDDESADCRPTYANIHSWLVSWLAQPEENDTVIIYFSGHGREIDGKSYLAPIDATLQSLHVTGIPISHIQDVLIRCKARQKILIIDACHSGSGKGSGAMPAGMFTDLTASKGIYTITSCDVNEISYEWPQKKQGVFSYYLCLALSGGCPHDQQGRLTAEAVYEWVYTKVQLWSAKTRCTQTPKRFAAGTGIFVLRTFNASLKTETFNIRENNEITESPQYYKREIPKKAPSRKRMSEMIITWAIAIIIFASVVIAGVYLPRQGRREVNSSLVSLQDICLREKVGIIIILPMEYPRDIGLSNTEKGEELRNNILKIFVGIFNNPNEVAVQCQDSISKNTFMSYSEEQAVVLKCTSRISDGHISAVVLDLRRVKDQCTIWSATWSAGGIATWGRQW